VIGAGDFNGDGDADILWQNTNGQAAVWLMNGITPPTQAARSIAALGEIGRRPAETARYT